jgi:hypothetical protein
MYLSFSACSSAKLSASASSLNAGAILVGAVRVSSPATCSNPSGPLLRKLFHKRSPIFAESFRQELGSTIRAKQTRPARAAIVEFGDGLSSPSSSSQKNAISSRVAV